MPISVCLCRQEHHVRKGWPCTAGTLPLLWSILQYWGGNYIYNFCFLFPAFNTEEMLRLFSLIFYLCAGAACHGGRKRHSWSQTHLAILILPFPLVWPLASYL